MTTNSSKPGSPSRAAPGYSRFIPREELGAFAAWLPETLDSAAGEASADAAAGPIDSTEQQARIAAARQGGYHDGYRDGLVALESFKHSHAAQMAAQLGTLLNAFDAQLAALEQQMADAVARSALLLARRVVRAELGTRPEHVAEVAQQALAAVLMSARHIRVLVHPDDHALVAAGAAESLQARGARLLAAPDIARGGCRIESDLGHVDAQIASRWAAAAATLGATLPWHEDDNEATA